MEAVTGDRIIVESAALGRETRLGEILSVLGEHGAPPWRVRWTDGSESLYCPGPDARIRISNPDPPPPASTASHTHGPLDSGPRP